MARKAKPADPASETAKSVPAHPDATNQATAAQAIPPESTLGDGDATGAGAEAAAAGTAPEAPAPAAADEATYGPEGWTVRVTGPAKGRWRAGRKFGPEAVAIAADELTDSDLEKLMADPELKVEIAENEA